MSLSEIVTNTFVPGRTVSKVLESPQFRKFLKDVALPGFEKHGKRAQAECILNSNADLAELIDLKGDDIWDHQIVGHNFTADRAQNAIGALRALKRGELRDALNCILLTRYVPENAAIFEGYRVFSSGTFHVFADAKTLAAATTEVYMWFTSEVGACTT